MQTGLRILSFHLDNIDINKFLKSPAFIESPPRVVVFKATERMYIYRSKQIGLNGDCQPRSAPSTTAHLLWVNPSPVKTHDYYRNSHAGLMDPNLNAAVHHLKRNIKNIFNKHSQHAYKLSLTLPGAFSNKLNHFVLVDRDDALKFKRKIEELDKASCRLLNLQNKIQENGKTLFVSLLAPDKLTVYAPFLQSTEFKDNSWYSRVAETNYFNMPRLDSALIKAVKDGAADVYLPNETHWGSLGHQIVARTLQEYLKRMGVLAPTP